MTTTTSTILVIGGHDDFTDVSQSLAAENCRVFQAERVDSALPEMGRPIDLAICDMGPRGTYCCDVMRLLHNHRPTTPVILIANADEVAEAIKAMKEGAADYITRPINGEELRVRATKWLETSRKEERLNELESKIDRTAPHSINGHNGHGIDIPTGTSLEDLERAAVEKALEQHRGNRTHAAKTLGISVRTLQRKLKAWRMPMLALQHRTGAHDFSMPLVR